MIHRSFPALLFCILVLAAVCNAQSTPCRAKLADLPAASELGGFHLGMTEEQVKTRVPQVKFGPKNEYGLSNTSISPDFDPRIDKTNFSDVRTISLDFLDDQLTSLWIGFEGSFKWNTAAAFVEGISRELALPQEWTTKGRSQQLTCADFQLSVSMIGGGPSLRIISLAAEETIAARRQALEDAAEGEDKPEPGPVVGDARSKLYYPKNCPALKSIPEKNRLAFENESDAEKAGFKRAAACQ